MKIALLFQAVAITCIASVAQALTVTPAEMDEARRWVAASFEGVQKPPATEVGIEVVANHGPVQANARGEKPLCIGSTTHSRGLYCHAPSELIVRLPGAANTFEAIAGVDTNDQTSGGRGSVLFSVGVGGQDRWHSTVMHEGMPGVPLSVDLGGSKEFTLRVEDAGDGISCDQSDWAEARVTLADGTVVWLGDLPLRGQQRAAYPTTPFFSFQYEGRPFGELVSTWKTERASRQLDAQRKEHTLTYSDPATGLEVRCVGGGCRRG